MSKTAEKIETPEQKLARKQEESTGRAPGPSRATLPATQDHKKKKTKPKKLANGLMEVIVEGVTVQVNPQGAKDWRFVEAIGAINAGEGTTVDLYTMISIMIPSRTERAKINAHLADGTGYVDPEAFMEFFGEAVKAAEQGNS